ncbi:PIN domain-containing protein [Treponema pedis]|uniref:PIN domain-containing protein n=1 Tax=Treponema pedis TaxID=409322 RepID=A0A7S6WRB8_9SPIR|nr:PIN domain-containing protein [Treponema pedis]QOW61367.1 PIN domain-containing protein [Treponema pedis]
MVKKVFVDTDVILDVALAREPFFSASKMILAMAENNIIIGNISSNCIANIYYILRKCGGDSNARKFILNIIKYITVITIDHQNVPEALKSKFPDFEDALQYYSAAKNQCEYIITRNIKDYKNSKIKALLPEEFIKMFQQK